MQAPLLPKNNERREDAIPQPAATASSNTQTSGEMSSFQNNLRALGINSDADQIFRALSRSLPGWMISTTDTGAAKSRNPAVEAMVQIFHLAENRWDIGKRFQEMVQAAIEQFNTGSLARAATMFDLALDVSSYRRLNSSIVAQARQSMHESLDSNRLRDFAKERNSHCLLQKVLNFFYEFTVDNMLDSLQKEQRRDRRRFLLVLLAAHGDAARKAVFSKAERADWKHGCSEQLAFRAQPDLPSHGHTAQRRCFSEGGDRPGRSPDDAAVAGASRQGGDQIFGANQMR